MRNAFCWTQGQPTCEVNLRGAGWRGSEVTKAIPLLPTNSLGLLPSQPLNPDLHLLRLSKRRTRATMNRLFFQCHSHKQLLQQQQGPIAFLLLLLPFLHQNQMALLLPPWSLLQTNRLCRACSVQPVCLKKQLDMNVEVGWSGMPCKHCGHCPLLNSLAASINKPGEHAQSPVCPEETTGQVEEEGECVRMHL